MKVIGVTEFGGPEALAIHDVPEPHAGPGQVRIKVRSIAVSPTDTGVRAGSNAAVTAAKEPPYVPGMDAAGVIDEVGDGAGFSLGDEVMAMALPDGEHGGAYVSHLVADADSVARIPAGTTLEAAATLPMNGLTAMQALRRLDLRPGQVLAVTGAAGTLGGYAVQLAKHAGLTVVADVAEKDRKLLEDLGPDQLVPRGADVAQHIRGLYPEGVDGLLDAAVQHEVALPAVKDGGGFATVRGFNGPTERGITIHQVFVPADYHADGKLDELRELVEAGQLSLRVADVLPAERAAEAHRRLEAGGVRGRLVLVFD
ncbi:NADP-dependent oxidoreductase [Arthrobacter rhombi]|uniref:NADP-dependent oxidoreductase n=1 Tax=Arthrobacter rhombi TaxID=71253 RepID=UPI003F90EC2A